MCNTIVFANNNYLLLVAQCGVLYVVRMDTNFNLVGTRAMTGLHTNSARSTMNSIDKTLSILNLFTDETAAITPEDVEALTGVSRSSAYRYIQSLVDVGLIAQIASGSYGLGARILELDRLHRNSDHLLAAAREPMERMSEKRGLNMILCRYYGNRVVCSHTVWPNPNLTQIYERGRPLPLFYGAMAKVILANLGAYQLRNLMLRYVDEVRAAGLGDDWKELRSNMIRLRKQGTSVTHAEITPESVGVAAALIEATGQVIGSVAFAVPRDEFERLDEVDLRKDILETATEIGARLHMMTDADESEPAPG